MKIFSLIVALLLTTTSCMKPPGTEIEKGPEASCEQIDQALSEIKGPSVLSLKQGEYTSIDSTTRLENLYPELTMQYLVTVMERHEDDKIISLRIRETTNEKIDGQFKISEKEATYEISKLLSKGTLSDSPYCQNQQAGKVLTYNKLEVSNFDIPIPERVRADANCGGLKNCSGPIAGKLFKFDRWIPDPNNPGKELKVTTSLVTSPDVPFFATVFSECSQFSWPVQGRQILVTSCNDVRDFKFGVN